MNNNIPTVPDLPEIMRLYDEACKTMLSNKQILARILKECVEEFKDCDLQYIIDECIEGTPEISKVPVSQNEVIRGLNTADTTVSEGNITYDILFSALTPGTGERIELIINLEAQNDYYPGYPLVKRALYYCSRLISAQKGRYFENSDYQNIRKVYSIWICTQPPKKEENTITEYRITKKDLVRDVDEGERNYDLLRVIMLRLGKRDKDLKSKILEFLDLILLEEHTDNVKAKLADEYNVAFNDGTGTEVSDMCNLSKGVLERGRAEGIAIGEARGMAAGIAEGRKSIIAELLSNGILTKEQAAAMANM